MSTPIFHSVSSPVGGVVLTSVAFDWPDGSVAIEGISGSFTVGRTGLVGDNGSGKTTLLRLIAGELRPSMGTIATHGAVAYLPQHVSIDPGVTVAQALGIAEKLAALAAIEAGGTDPALYDTIGEDWDIESRAEQTLTMFNAGIALTAADVTRPMDTLSGGEAMAVAMAGIRLRGAEVTLLDEPTNDLDRRGRAMVIEAMERWPGTVVVASHDRELLEDMDDTAEIHSHSLAVFGGPYSAWRAAVDAQQEAAERAETAAKSALNKVKRQQAVSAERLDRQAARGKAKAMGEGMPKIIRHAMKNTAEANQARSRGLHSDRLDKARADYDAAQDRVREDQRIRFELPDPGISSGRKIAEITWDEGGAHIVQGPERLALTGPNGGGKTTLLRRLMGLDVDVAAPAGPRAELFTDRVGYLPQGDDGLDAARSALELLRAAAPHTSESAIRNTLASLLLRGDAPLRPVGDLSGGERFRVGLARLLFAEPTPELIVLDEPTNHLDLTSVAQLTDALTAYQGALIVVSHDETFLNDLKLDLRLNLDHGALVPEILSHQP